MTRTDEKTVFLYHSRDDPGPWLKAFHDCAPELEMRVNPDLGRPEDIFAAFVFAAPHGLLASLPNLGLIHSKGAGVDHIFADPDLPSGVPVVRLVDPSARLLMTQYVVHAALGYHRHMDVFAGAQAAAEWRSRPPPDTGLTTVGVLGLGAIGRDVARALRALGFRVVGWSRTAKEIEDIECFHGPDALAEVLEQSRILVCLLALTPETEDIIDRRTLSRLPAGAYVINAARGNHVVEDDLLSALDTGHVAGATLDVFRTEPLPRDHRFWTHPRVTVTPHISADAVPRTAAREVAENIRRALAGEPLMNQVDRGRGY